MQHMGLGKFPFKDQGKEKNQPERSASTGQQNNLKAKPQRKVAKFSKTEAGEPKKLAFKLRLCNEIGTAHFYSFRHEGIQLDVTARR